jgi:hypothetical protein
MDVELVHEGNLDEATSVRVFEKLMVHNWKVHTYSKTIGVP